MGRQCYATSHEVRMKTILILTFLASLQLVLAGPEPRRRYSSSKWHEYPSNNNNWGHTTARPYPWYHTTTRSPYRPPCPCADNPSPYSPWSYEACNNHANNYPPRRYNSVRSSSSGNH